MNKMEFELSIEPLEKVKKLKFYGISVGKPWPCFLKQWIGFHPL